MIKKLLALFKKKPQKTVKEVLQEKFPIQKTVKKTASKKPAVKKITVKKKKFG